MRDTQTITPALVESLKKRMVKAGFTTFGPKETALYFDLTAVQAADLVHLWEQSSTEVSAQ